MPKAIQEKYIFRGQVSSAAILAGWGGDIQKIQQQILILSEWDPDNQKLQAINEHLLAAVDVIEETLRTGMLLKKINYA
jgi:hypothetical protein